MIWKDDVEVLETTMSTLMQPRKGKTKEHHCMLKPIKHG